MIPKIIHLCWLSGEEYPQDIKTCLESWHKYLPDYRLLIAETSYSSFAAQLGEYLEEYNATHDEPLLHDAGALIGQPIEARVY